MKSNKTKPLTGANNQRLTKHTPTNSQQTAAWSDIDKLKIESNVSIPSEESVEEAKDWVDNGSQL